MAQQFFTIKINATPLDTPPYYDHNVPTMTKSGAKKGRPYTFTSKSKASFISELQRLGSYKAAAASINISVRTIRRHREDDPEFQEACDTALGALQAELESVARLLAIEGVVEQSFDRTGSVIRERVRYDVKVLLRWLARLDPERWSDVRKVETQHSGQIDHEHKGSIKVEELDSDQQRAARRLLQTDRNLN